MHSRRVFKQKGRGRSLYSSLMILSVLILASSLLAASHSMWSSQLRINSSVKTGFFKANICSYHVSAYHHCGCSNITASLSDDRETLHVVFEPTGSSGNSTLHARLVVVNNATIPLVLTGISVESTMPHGEVLADYKGVYNASIICGACCTGCIHPLRPASGTPMHLNPGEAAIVHVDIPGIEAGSGGEISIHIVSQPSG